MKMNEFPAFCTAILLLALPFMAQADESFTGKIIGYECAVEGHVCPLDKLDPHIVLSRDFVLVTGGEYYFLPNLPRDTKVRYFLDTVTVKGKLDKKHNSIEVDELIVAKNGKNKTVWSPSMQRRAFGSPDN